MKPARGLVINFTTSGSYTHGGDGMGGENDVSNLSEEMKRKVRDWLLQDDYSIEERQRKGWHGSL